MQLVFKFAAEKLKDAGAKLPKGCIPVESSDMEQSMQFKSYSGCRPSIWVLPGFPMITLANFEEVLSMISSLAMKGSLFLGDLPACLAETDTKIKMESWRREFQRIENEGDEDGFEEL
ncbi:hypothetical protein V8G54_020886 [Vigna mungo]|uniref:Uncharacterized protein n=1 Tax=Vigna mungo TaxID=3915 RepID=A0AAQ3NEK3_VIGMU